MIFSEILNILKTSEASAYCEKSSRYSYSELYNLTCNIHSMIEQWANGRNPVIVYGKKEIYMKAAFLACIFSGIAYVPIDKSMPESRIEDIINQVEPSLIIGDYEHEGIRNITTYELSEALSAPRQRDIESIKLNENDTCYIIFTSGSTGSPKGVMVSYSNLDSCIKWLKQLYSRRGSVILNQAKFSFDLSVADFYLSLATESEHYIVDSDTLDFRRMFAEIANSNANLAVMTPSFADLLLLDASFSKSLLPELEAIIFCGETLHPKTSSRLHERFDKLKIINCYGPTECTFAVTAVTITENMEKQLSLPVGRPKNDVEIIIVDDSKRPVSEGTAGEIIITGKSVAKGYVGGNNGSFIDYNGTSAYITGDIGYTSGGMLYYKCRKDNQIKFKGYRIELNDIEENLNSLEYVEKAVVTVKKSNDIATRIIAYVKLKEAECVNSAAIKADLRKRLPDYMLPSIKTVEHFELNQNGKCDIRKLSEEKK